MTTRLQIQEIPGALSKTIEKARAEYGAIARKLRLGDGPILVTGEGEALGIALSASGALESFPGWPVVAHPAEIFQTYASPLLKPHAVLVMISAGENRPASLELLETAKKRGAVVVVLGNSAENPLMALAQHQVLIAPEMPTGSPAMTLCLHAALNLFALEAAQALKRPEPHWKSVSEEFVQLPEKIDWLFAQLTPLVRSFAAELSKVTSLQIVGGGLFEYAVLRAAQLLRSRQGIHAEAMFPAAFLELSGGKARAAEAVFFISGSHSKLKEHCHAGAEQARAAGVRVLSLTDGNDRDLATGSDLGILIPTLQESPASTVALFMLEWMMAESSRAAKG
jgi:fructoselysine-6-P-deglycase FrlB-like protein